MTLSKELIDNAGTQFDPAIVPVFVDLFVSGEFPFFAKTAEAEASAAQAA